MDDGRDASFPLPAYPVYEEHIWARQGAVEDHGRPLSEYHGGHGPELIPALYVVHALQALAAPRVREEATVPEGARTVLAASLEPGDDAIPGQYLRNRLGDIPRALGGDVRPLQPGRELVV